MEEYYEAIRLYEENVIPKGAKNELIRNFLAHFSKSAKDSFIKLVNKRLRLPTPDEKDWLIENINRYYKHYKDDFKKPNVDSQLSLLNQTAS